MNEAVTSFLIFRHSIRPLTVSIDLGQLHPVIYAAAAVLVTAVLMMVACRIAKRQFQKRKEQEMASMVGQFIDERNKSGNHSGRPRYWRHCL